MRKMEASFFMAVLKPAEHHQYPLSASRGDVAIFSDKLLLESSNSLKLLGATQDGLEAGSMWRFKLGPMAYTAS